MSSTSTRLPRDAQLLATLAEPLKPKRAPFYVSGNDQGHPDGWYWIPHDATRAQYLGRNVIWAEKRLLEHLRDAQTAKAV